MDSISSSETRLSALLEELGSAKKEASAIRAKLNSIHLRVAQALHQILQECDELEPSEGDGMQQVRLLFDKVREKVLSDSQSTSYSQMFGKDERTKILDQILKRLDGAVSRNSRSYKPKKFVSPSKEAILKVSDCISAYQNEAFSNYDPDVLRGKYTDIVVACYFIDNPDKEISLQELQTAVGFSSVMAPLGVARRFLRPQFTIVKGKHGYLLKKVPASS